MLTPVALCRRGSLWEDALKIAEIYQAIKECDRTIHAIVDDCIPGRRWWTEWTVDNQGLIVEAYVPDGTQAEGYQFRLQNGFVCWNEWEYDPVEKLWQKTAEIDDPVELPPGMWPGLMPVLLEILKL